MSSSPHPPPPANKKGSFTFGKYVSPNPKPISLGGVKLEPSPHIEYKTQQTVETENKVCSSDLEEPAAEPEAKQQGQKNQEQQQQQEEQVLPDVKCKANDSVDDLISPRSDDNNNSNNNDNDDSPSTNVSSASTTRSHSVDFSELDSLKAKMVKLKLDKTANANANTNANKDDERRRIAFNSSVEIVDGDCHTNTERETLNDKVSSVRVQRNQTPYKLKSNADYRSHATSSRMLYRTTPIPPRNKQVLRNRVLKKTNHAPTATSTVVASTSSCVARPSRSADHDACDKENINVREHSLEKTIDHGSADVSEESSSSVGKPDNKSANTSADLMQFAFNRNASTPSFVSVDSSSQEYAYPVSPIPSGKASRSLGSPILTPLKSINNPEPFDFQWNKNKH